MKLLYHQLQRFKQKILIRKMRRHLAVALCLVASYFVLYFAALLLIRPLSLTWNGILFVPAMIVIGILTAAAYDLWKLRDLRYVAAWLERHRPGLGLSLRTALDFKEGRADENVPTFQDSYVQQVGQALQDVTMPSVGGRRWGKHAFWSCAAALSLLLFFGDRIAAKFYEPGPHFGQTHLDLNEGSITIYEPEYTQIPGRTLPLKPGTFQAYPGARVRFAIQPPSDNALLYFTDGSETPPQPLVRESGGQIVHEFVLLQAQSLQFLLSDDSLDGRTQPYLFEPRKDDVPEIALRNHTEEGPINVLNRLMLEALVKDDFGVANLELVVGFDGQEKRISLAVPPDRKKNFISHNSWNISDFGLPDVSEFTVRLEAKDNNPFDGPGVAQSRTLTFELESAEKKYDEFMAMAKELLDSMTHVLGDNLETYYSNPEDLEALDEAEQMGRNIRLGLFNSQNLTAELLSKSRQVSEVTDLDQDFLMNFRSQLNGRIQSRTDMGFLFANIANRRMAQQPFKSLVKLHMEEELKVETMTYDLLLQLKLWAMFKQEQQEKNVQDLLDQMEELMSERENMSEEAFNEAMEQMMEQLMREMQQMFQTAASSMDMQMSEFFNMEGMQENQDSMEALKEALKKALEEGDMDAVKQIMAQLREMTQQTSSQVREAMGQMSPEMQEMAQAMREMRGLLRELKEQQENLQGDTQSLKQMLDKMMGADQERMSPQQKAEYKKITERLQQLLSGLHDNLVDLKAQEATMRVLDQIAESKSQLEDPDLSTSEKRRLQEEVHNLERALDFVMNETLDRLQNNTLRSLEHVERMQDYLDQGELMLTLETGQKLDAYLHFGLRLSESSASPMVQQQAQPSETYDASRKELDKIMEALSNLRDGMEQRRQQFMQQTGEQRQMKLAQRQSELRQMIQQFMENAPQQMANNPFMQKLSQIGQTMQQGQGQLQQSRMESGLSYEQRALQQIGELQEQMNQAGKGNNMPSFMPGNQTGWNGHPTGEVYIPESQFKAQKNQMKETVRRQLQRNLPDNYGKEIRKYYEKLMDE